MREQLVLKDGKMYTEDNPDSAIELDPIESNWGVNNPDPSTWGDAMGPLG